MLQNHVISPSNSCPELSEGIGFVFPYFHKSWAVLALELDITSETIPLLRTLSMTPLHAIPVGLDTGSRYHVKQVLDRPHATLKGAQHA